MYISFLSGCLFPLYNIDSYKYIEYAVADMAHTLPAEPIPTAFALIVGTAVTGAGANKAPFPRSLSFGSFPHDIVTYFQNDSNCFDSKITVSSVDDSSQKSQLLLFHHPLSKFIAWRFTISSRHVRCDSDYGFVPNALACLQAKNSILMDSRESFY